MKINLKTCENCGSIIPDKPWHFYERYNIEEDRWESGYYCNKEDRSVSADVLEDILDAVEILSPERRLVFDMRSAGRGFAEIARRIGRSAPWVSQNYWEACKLVNKHFRFLRAKKLFFVQTFKEAESDLLWEKVWDNLPVCDQKSQGERWCSGTRVSRRQFFNIWKTAERHLKQNET